MAEDEQQTKEEKRQKQAEKRRKEGYWPHWLKRFWWDLLPGWLPDRVVPPQGGIQVPAPEDPEWINASLTATQEAVEQSRRAHDQQLHRGEEAEKKSRQLLQLALALLAFALGAAGYEVSFLKGHNWPSAAYWLLAPTALAIFCLIVAAIVAAEGDRPGLYRSANAGPLVRTRDPKRAIVAAEERARRVAAWTARHKLNDYLTARAWLTRGLVALTAAAVIAVAFQALPLSALPTAAPRPASRPSPAVTAAAATTPRATTSPRTTP